MCGIFGYFNFANNSLDDQIVRSMGEIISYRGPDGMGYYHDRGRALGNQRLAILDIEHGEQPFVSEDGSIIVVQNGEIFNHVELAKELLGTEYECKTTCDTEVILRLYQKHGIDFINLLNGMFAISIYDKHVDMMYLIRDRVGEKPLYYYEDECNLIYSSEIKSILRAGVEPKVNITGLDSYITYNYVLPPLTLFENIYHIKPGTYLEIRNSGCTEVSWWELSNVSVNSDIEENVWIENFNDLLEDAVKIRLRSDVPFGAFLSGGVDSSSVVGLMAKHLKSPVKTFSIGFHDKKYDESPFAEEAAKRFSTEHYCEKVEANLLGLWDKVIYHCDQPHGDVSFMPTYKVADLASHHVKMVLTGDGADELFAGYDKYRSFFLKGNLDALTEEEFEHAYLESISLFNSSQKNKLYGNYIKTSLEGIDAHRLSKSLFKKVKHHDKLNQVLYIDTQLLLSGNNLVKPDRMGMAVSIENRAPFLDYRMIEMAFSMPGELKLKNNETKYIYKKAVSELIGDSLAYRKKQMFTVPIGEWLKNELRDLVHELLFSDTATNRNLFNTVYVKELYDSHCQGIENNTREIRALMALEIWFREFID